MDSSLDEGDFYSALMDFRNENVARNPIERVAPPNVEIQTDERSLTGRVLQTAEDIPAAEEPDTTTGGSAPPPPPPPPPPAGTFTISASPSSVTAAIGAFTHDVTVSLSRSNFSDSIRLEYTGGLPSGATMGFTGTGATGWGAAASTPDLKVRFIQTNGSSPAGTYSVTLTAKSNGSPSQTATVKISVTFTSNAPPPPPPPPGGGPPSSAGLGFSVNLNPVQSVTWNKLNVTRVTGIIASLGRSASAYQSAISIRVSGASWELDSNSHDPLSSKDANEHGALNFGGGGGSQDITVTFKAVPVGFNDFSPPLSYSVLFHMHN